MEDTIKKEYYVKQPNHIEIYYLNGRKNVSVKNYMFNPDFLVEVTELMSFEGVEISFQPVKCEINQMCSFRNCSFSGGN